MDTKKYIIDLPDNTAWLQWVKVADKDGNVYFDSKNPEDLTPYIEPDLDTVRNEAYQQGYKKCLSELKEEGMKIAQNTRGAV